MSPHAIATYWHTQGEALTPYAPEALAEWGLEPATIRLLTMGGLPPEAAPYLSFTASLARVSTTFRLGPEFAHFVQLGSDGSGNPLVLNTAAHDRVEWLDHETGFAAQYVNRSLLAFAASLVAYHSFVEDVLATRGEDAYLNADFTDTQLAALQQHLVAEDELAMTEPGFWQREISTLLVNRAEYHP
ncbi:hypothetical protein DNI29_22020 [Hymenobacter sediminis]|uniref:SUKH-4 family immunity protein n=1 Tax=Hymenobacter sediminis TaxID=2218621 RepID=UPI000DA68CCD|nr:SUKH-4 family immunity protein [Hymenobacter sediminis]RPD44383.1 hypothetical protein DNI29_22020 [Hymenobacter sediminis]